jgi:hypothetical protein
VQALVLEGELPFVDDQPGVKAAPGHGVEDLVEGHHLVGKALAQQQAQGQEGRRQRAGHGDADAAQLLDGQRPACHHHGSVAIAHAAAAGQEGVLIEQQSIGMDADGGHLQFAAQRPAIECLDVLQFMAEIEVAGVQLVVRQRVEHEGVVGVGAVAHGDDALVHRHTPLGAGRKVILSPRQQSSSQQAVGAAHAASLRAQ